jgi:vitamin B12 transporter
MQKNRFKPSSLLAAVLCASSSTLYAADTLPETVVTATRIAQPLQHALNHTTVLTQQDIQDSQAVDVPSLLKGLAGVEFYQSGGMGTQSSVRMRGAESGHTLVLLDGVRLNSATAGTTAIDQLMLDQVERIEVVRGNVSSLYGSEAVGGVIQIFTKHGSGDPKATLDAGFGSNNTQRLAAGFGGQSGGTNFNVQMSHVKTAGISAINPSLVATANPDKDGYDNNSLSANVSHALNADHRLLATLFASRGKVQLDNPSTFGTLPTDVNNSTAMLSKFSLAAHNRLSDAWQSKLQWAQGTDSSRTYLNGLPDPNGGYLRTQTRQLNWQNELALGANGVLLAGVESLSQSVASDAATVFTQTGRHVNAMFGGYTGSYGAHQVQVNLRQDRYSDFGAARTGLLGYGYEINPAWRVTANLSTAFKAPTFNDMYSPAAWGGNPALKPEHARNTELGLHYMATGQQLDAVYFDNRVRDRIVYQFPLMQNLNQTRSTGLEVSYSGQFGETAVKAAFTAQNPRDSKTGLVLLRRAKSFAHLGVTQKLGAWQVGGEIQHNGARVDADILTGARTPLSGYSVVNLTANYALQKSLSLSFSVSNLFNRDYTLAHGYNTLGRTLFVGVNYR